MINIALIGQSGCGKSSLINCIRGLYASSKDAAEVDVKECTTHPRRYPFPNKSNIILWDLQGVNTPNYPLDTYMDKIQSNKYDFFIICSHSRFHQTDFVLAAEIRRKGKAFCFVRLKFDEDIEGRQSKLNRELNEQEIESLMNEIKLDIRNRLNQVRSKQPSVFVVSALMVRFKNIDNRNKYDFKQLMMFIMNIESQLRLSNIEKIGHMRLKHEQNYSFCDFL
jgi:predicted GTPase